MSTSLTLAANTGTPYNVTTGFDDNGDAIFNDRPAGGTRNSVRTAAQYTWSLNATYGINVGTRPGATGSSGRYRVSFTANATTSRIMRTHRVHWRDDFSVLPQATVV